MSRPEEHRRELADGAKNMLDRGVIISDEWLELCDLITGAYSFAIEQWKTWLSPETSLELAYDTIALARQDFEAYRISTDVGSVRNQGAQLIEPI